ncbi:MAG TPA: ATP-binding cassette domain-containing protein [Ktedonobacterales bacterium]|nr:ATP-binding cassette domain-containing protein [Ktedonobacterales bacterium]
MLQVRRLEKIIEQRTVLSIEQLDVAPGEVLGVIGPIGSGKTLLIRLLAGMVTPSGGSVVFDGQDMHHTPALRARMGLLFEEDLLYERHSAQSNLETYCQVHGLPGSRAKEMLTLVGLSDQAKTSANKLSIPAQRRLALARALLAEPALLLLDQPTLRLDLDSQALFARLITQAASAGTVVVLTDEDISWAGKCCARIIELEDGRVASNYQIEAAQGPAAPERLIPYKVPARKDDRIVLYDPGDLLYATSRDGKTILRTASEEATTNLTLQELEGRLVGRGFFKAHRAYLVNLQHIKAVIQYTRNSYTLQLDDKQETLVPLSKQSEKELQELLGY